MFLPSTYNKGPTIKYVCTKGGKGGLPKEYVVNVDL